MEKSIKMVEELTEKRKLTSKVKTTLNKEIFINIIVAILIVTYYMILNIIYLNTDSNLANNITKIFSLVAIAITVFVFEFAYRKDSLKIMIFGIELFVCSVIILCIPKIYKQLYNIKKIIFLFFPLFCVIYYFLKSWLIYKKIKFNYQNNLSDVREIMKED